MLEIKSNRKSQEMIPPFRPNTHKNDIPVHHQRVGTHDDPDQVVPVFPQQVWRGEECQAPRLLVRINFQNPPSTNYLCCAERKMLLVLTDAHSVPSQPWSNVEQDFASPIAFFDRLIKSLVRREVLPSSQLLVWR